MYSLLGHRSHFQFFSFPLKSFSIEASCGSLEAWSVAARVSVSQSTFRGRDESLKEEYKGSLKIGSG